MINIKLNCAFSLVLTIGRFAEMRGGLSGSVYGVPASELRAYVRQRERLHGGNEGHPAPVGGPSLLNPFAGANAQSASIFVDELDTELPLSLFLRDEIGFVLPKFEGPGPPHSGTRFLNPASRRAASNALIAR